VVAIYTSRRELFDPEGLDVPKLLESYRQGGSAFVERASTGERIDWGSVLRLPVDVLCPCANIHAIQEENVGEIQVRVICPGANNHWIPEVEVVLEPKDALLPPDFAANSRGILGIVMAYASFSHVETETFILEGFEPTARYLLEEAER